MAAWAPPPDPPPHPPTSENFPQEKNEIYQRAPKLEVDFGHTNFLLASDPPPPPRYRSRSPLSVAWFGVTSASRLIALPSW